MGDRLVWKRGRESQNETGPSSSGKFETADKTSVNFLYNKEELDKESYLTGKKVDKNFIAYLEIEKNNFDKSLNPNKNRADGEFDLGRKVREDPLAVVKEKENERFKKLQANPQKMERMKKLMMAYMGGQESSDSSSASEEDKPKMSKKTINDRKRSSSRDRKRQKRRSRSRDRKRSKSRDRKRDKERESKSDRDRRRSRDRKRSKSRSKSRSPKRPGYGLIVPGGKKSEKSKQPVEKYESQFSKYKIGPEGYTRKKEHGFANKMSAEEKARKLAEMSSNAEWRDETRKSRVKKGREQDEKEEKEIKTNDHSYYRNIKMAATDKSLEERVKARTSANQKTSAALDKNWTKR